MRAIVQDQYGETADVLRLEEIDPPQIGDDDVLIRVQAASVHIGDWHVMAGLPYLLRVVGFGLEPQGPCTRHGCRGNVEAVGPNVTQFQAGDEVFGTSNGSFAEYASAPRARSLCMPANLTFRTGGGRPHFCRRRAPALRDAGGIKEASRSCSSGRREASGCSRCRSPNRSALR